MAVYLTGGDHLPCTEIKRLIDDTMVGFHRFILIAQQMAHVEPVEGRMAETSQAGEDGVFNPPAQMGEGIVNDSSLVMPDHSAFA